VKGADKHPGTQEWHSPARAWRARVLPLFLLTLLAGVPLCARADREADFDAANRLYEEGKYADAAAAYDTLRQTNPGSEVLLFNLGNALFKSGQIGRAIAAYREAQAMAPRDPDLRANLKFARDQVRGTTLPISQVEQWLGRMTLNEWTVVTAAVFWLWLLLLALLQWRPGLRPSLRWHTTGLAAVAVFCGVCLGISLRDRRSERVAVVIVGGTAHQGPFEGSPTAFSVQDGAELRVLDRKAEWLQVSPGQRRIGWMHQNQALVTSGASRS